MYKKSVLDNGLRVVTEQLPSHNVSLGIWIDAGSRDEDPQDNGCAHFIEHMLFKGTPSRTAGGIAREIDGLGGMVNAFTAKETTCLYGTVLDDQLPNFISLLSDLFFNSTFDAEEIARERQVILQEIGMVEDTPEDLALELFSSMFWQGHPLGRTVLGAPEIITNMTQAQLKKFILTNYTADRILIAAAGNIRHEDLLPMLTEFNALSASQATITKRKPPVTAPSRFQTINKRLEQVHLLLGAPSPPIKTRSRYQLILLNILLGGNMSSRLFQQIREKRGLAYNIYSFIDANSDSGMLGIYAGVSLENTGEVISLINETLNGICEGRISQEELEQARNFARAGMYLAGESMENRMTRLARNELYLDRYISFEEAEQELAKVSCAQIIQAGEKIFRTSSLSGIALGPAAE